MADIADSSKGSVADYIHSFDNEVQGRLLAIREAAFELVPDAEEAIKYRMPTIIFHGNLLHYAAFAHHIGIYPLPHVIETLKADLAPYRQGKGSIQFQNDEPLPMDLIRKIITTRLEEKMRELELKKKGRT